jgi:peptidyl-prolyl cis-trans isomerase C
MTSQTPSQVIGSSRLQRFAREPLLQFLLLGLALFVAAHALNAWHKAHERRLIIDPALVAYQRNLYHVQFGVYPDAQTQEVLIQSYIHDEALYREALRLGLDAEDEVIRQRLIQKMEFVLTDATPPPAPDDATLQRFLDEHATHYSVPGRVSFDLLYFADRDTLGGSGNARAQLALQQLTAGKAAVHGDSFALGNTFALVDQDELTRRFGESEMAAAPLHAPLQSWAGPYRSGYGSHLIRVTAREPARSGTLAELREQLRTDWLADFREQDQRQRIAVLIAQHKIVRRDRSPAP